MLFKRKFKVTVASLSLVSSLAIMPFNLNVANADEIKSVEQVSGDKVMSSQQIQEAQIISNYLSFERKDDIGVFIVSNVDQLQTELKNIGSSITVEEINLSVDEMNTKLVQENGIGETTESLVKSKNFIQYGTETAPKRVKRGCSSWVGGVGLVHTAAVSGAGVLLGVSGPVGWAVGTGMAVAYYAGSLACPN